MIWITNKGFDLEKTRQKSTIYRLTRQTDRPIYNKAYISESLSLLADKANYRLNLQA